MWPLGGRLLMVALVALLVIPDAAAGAVPLGATAADSFNQPNDANLGNADTGQAWSVPSGAAGIVDQQAESAAVGYTLAMLDSNTSSGSAAISVPFITDEFWLIVRGSDPTNYWRFGRWLGGTYELQKIVNNGIGAQVQSTVLPATGDRLSCQLGTTISCLVNGSAAANTSDGFNATSRLAGFAAFAAPARFDDFAVTIPCPAAVTHGSAYGVDAFTLDGMIIAESGKVSSAAPGSSPTSQSGALTVTWPVLVSAKVGGTLSTSKLGPSSSTASAAVSDLSLLGGAVKATSVTAVSTSTASPSGASVGSSGSGIIGLTVNGAKLNLPPNSTVPVKVLGITVAELHVYKEAGSTALTNDTRSAAHSVDMLRLVMLKPTLGIPIGTQVIISHAATDAQSPVAAVCVPPPV